MMAGSKGDTRVVVYTGSTLEEALKGARNNLLIDEEVIEEKTSLPSEEVLKTKAFDEYTASLNLNKVIGGHARIVEISLLSQGKKRFLGIGKKPNIYEARIFRPALVELVTKRKTKIREETGAKPATEAKMEDSNVVTQIIVAAVNSALATLKERGVSISPPFAQLCTDLATSQVGQPDRPSNILRLRNEPNLVLFASILLDSYLHALNNQEQIASAYHNVTGVSPSKLEHCFRVALTSAAISSLMLYPEWGVLTPQQNTLKQTIERAKKFSLIPI